MIDGERAIFEAERAAGSIERRAEEAGTVMLPPLPYPAWEETHRHLHLMAQLVGKIRLGLEPRRPHWWHVPFYVAPEGLTTAAMPSGEGLAEMVLDLRRHRLVLRSSWGEPRHVDLGEGSLADFHARVVALLARAGIEVDILARPFDPAKVGSDVPFAADHESRPYDRKAVNAFADVLVGITPIFQAFRGRFLGKSTPVHLFWHSMDLALTRFNGREGPDLSGADPVTRDAYSHEVISFGFWAGDPSAPEPAFYAYAAPEPGGLADERLAPDGALWHDTGSGLLALFPYERMRTSDDPRAALLTFLETCYRAMARRAEWPVETFHYAPAYEVRASG